jgi:hypothetical protein
VVPAEYGCHEQDPAEVAAALRQAAFAIAGRFENVTGTAVTEATEVVAGERPASSRTAGRARAAQAAAASHLVQVPPGPAESPGPPCRLK